MMPKTVGRIIELTYLHDGVRVFEDREAAGKVLAGLLETYRETGALVLGIPAGGVSVGAVIARTLGLELDVAVTSKITLPWNTEMGYGAVAFDGTVLLNEEVLAGLGLTDRQVQEGIEKTRAKVARRLRLLRGDRPPPAVAGRTCILVDDGLATGSTMRVAAMVLQRAGAGNLVVAVPTGHVRAVLRLARHADVVYCANVRSGQAFAVADAYHHWYDVSEAEAAEVLAACREAVPPPERA